MKTVLDLKKDVFVPKKPTDVHNVSPLLTYVIQANYIN